jgi:hypothetical protein
MEKMHDYSCLLLIIDMQTGFYTAEDPVTVSSVVEELQFAWAFGNPVVVVTFKGQGELVAGVKELVEQLDSQVSIFFVEKTTDDGSALVAQALTEAGIASPQRLRVCGVNINYCVKATVTGLSALLPQTTIEVVARGCNCERGREFNHFGSFPNVQVLSEPEQSDQPDELISDVASAQVEDGRGDIASPDLHSRASYCDLVLTMFLALILILMAPKVTTPRLSRLENPPLVRTH